MFRIGEFARLLGVSVRTLRHYEDVGILRARRDHSTGYRSYTSEHLRLMRQVLALRQMGFSLRRIKQVSDGLPPGQFAQLLRVTYDELRAKHEQTAQTLRILEA